MKHPRHDHPVRLEGDEPNPFECSGCKEPGCGPRYRCERGCPFVLHKDCSKACPESPSIGHPLVDNSRFKFLWEPPRRPKRLFCVACGGAVKGFVYHDRKHDLVLHPCCMNLKSTMSDPSEKLTLNLDNKMPSKCVKCKEKVLKVQSKRPFTGWSYVSSCEKYCYHVYCVKKLIPDGWKSGSFNGGSSSSSSLRGRNLSTHGTASSSSITSAKRSSALARRRSSRSSVTRGLIKVVKIGLSVIMSLLLGNPTPLFTAVAENWLG
ncbi:uncharacterized protein LOC114739741 [Neltuma alba]|uniref:uncharacterized protein LOC114739741 n=1 Tax=Neltuma alba TaxID=207710 RepID=UPI0010A58E9E|nr:uncharacterized protein LOC114739741 [Prosopis alba]